jgi:hypothetical protein
MTFGLPLLIGGCVLALGPVIIHIIFRRRFRTTEFAAMRFLLESLRRNKQRLRTEELILIALRVLVCLLVGLALANFRSAVGSAGSSAPSAHVFILDDSLSMGQQIGTATLFQKAVTEVGRRLDSMSDADLVAVISASRPRSGEPLGKLVPAIDIKRDRFTTRLTAMRPTDMAADLPGALGEALKLVSLQQNMPVRVYVVGDCRAREYSGAERTSAVRKAFAAFDQRSIEIILLDFGMPCANNLAVEKVELGRKLVVGGVETPVKITVRNFGTAASEPTTIDVQAGEVRLPVLPVPAMVPGEAAEVTFRYTFTPSGSHWVSAVLPPDTLPGDNAGSLALEARESVHALIVDGSPDPDAAGSASFCLAYALDPSAKGAFAQSVEVRQSEMWKPSGLGAYDFMVLTNVRDLPVSHESGKESYPHVRALEEYVRNGGGLGIFLGPSVSAEFYNGPLYADGRGLSPAKISVKPYPEPDPASYVRLDPRSIGGDTMLRIFSGRGERFSRMIRFYVFASVDEVSPVSSVTAGPVSVLARFEDKAGTPAVLRRAYGRGTVLFWTTSADTKWSNWPKDLSFLPVMNDMGWELARPADESYVDTVGTRILYSLSARLSEATAATLKTPAYPVEDVQSLPMHHDGRQRLVTYADVRVAGVYELAFTLPDRSEQKVFFARRVDQSESDLTKASEGQVRAAIDRPYRHVGDLAVKEASAEQEAPRKALWWLFVAMLLGVLGLETFLGQRFGHYEPRVRNALEPAVK